MKSDRSVIIGFQLRQAREFLQLEPEDIANEINVSAQDIINWEEEQARPNLKQLEELAEIYGREIDYFLKETPPLPGKIEFRFKPAKYLREVSKETLKVLGKFDELCRTSNEFEELLEKKIKITLPKFKETDIPKEAAQSLRKLFNVGNKPLRYLNLRNILENMGLRIFELPILGDEFSGFSYWHPEYGPCILLNANEMQGRRNFTLAHELAHLIYKHGHSVCNISLESAERIGNLEYKANQFAVELLLPESGVIEDFRRRNLSTTPTERELANMAYSKWGVSIQALGYRLENLGLIKRGHTDTLFEVSKPAFLRRPKEPKWERQLGKRFIEISFEAYRKGLISSGKLANSLGITIRKTFEEIAKRT